MTCAVSVSTLDIPTLAKVRDLHVIQHYGPKNKFKKNVSLTELDEGKKYILTPMGYAVKELSISSPNSFLSFAKISTTVLSSFSLKETQMPIVNTSLGLLNKYNSLLMTAECNTGKTCMSLYIAIKLGYKFIFATPRINLVRQTLEDSKKLLPDGDLQLVTSDVKIDPKAKGYVISTHILHNYTQDDFFGVGTLIVDELHLAFTGGFIPTLFNYQPLYFIGLTATPKRYDGLDKAFGMYFHPDSRVKLDKRNPIVLYEVRTILQPPEIYNHFTKSLEYRYVEDSISECEWRNRFIGRLAYLYRKDKVIIVCKRKLQVLRIFESMKEYEKSDIIVDTFYGNKAIWNPKADVIIGINSKLGAGLDGEFNVIIIATSLRRDVPVHQAIKRVGRRRSEPLVIDLVDDISILNTHFREREKEYKRLGIVEKRTFKMTEREMVETTT